MPDWEDRVDPNYSLEEDSYSTYHKNNVYKNDVYSHEIYDVPPPYDGILVSLSNYRTKLRLHPDNNGSFTIRGFKNLRDYFRIANNSNLTLMADCGAFNYVSEPNPPEPFYSTENVANLYDKLGFDFGVSVDHMAVRSYRIKGKNGRKKTVNLHRKEQIERVNITLRNAKEFLELTKEKRYSYTPIGVIQGFNKKSYLDSAMKTVAMGYDYVAIGGLVQYTSDYILGILTTLQPALEGRKVHLFGVLRPQYLGKFQELGVTSFDSASYLRKAWLRSGQNYLSPNGKWYAAIRVPFSTDRRISAKALELSIKDERLSELEQKALRSLRSYADYKLTLEITLNRIMEYDKLLIRNSEDGHDLRRRYEKTLKDRPWESCNCKICRDLGIEVLIFRGTTRNKQRGFHNTWLFRNKFYPYQSPPLRVAQKIE